MQQSGILVAGAVEPAKLEMIQHVYKLWGAALSARNIDAAAELYALDAVLETPLARRILKSEHGIIEGRSRIRDYLRAVFAKKSPAMHLFRAAAFTDGRKLIWEYPRIMPGGEQMDFVESMVIENDLIHHHCVYWGWVGVKVLDDGEYWS